MVQSAPPDRPFASASLRARARAVLAEADCVRKIDQATQLAAASTAGDASGVYERLEACAGIPGRPQRPVLVPPTQVPKRNPRSPEGRAALIHALAHIEFNAINLALDAVWRFPDLPDAFYRDWIRIAGEEAHHFSLLQAHLHRLGHAYGDFEAHDGLWAMAEKTCGDVLARIALVPRTLEARGLDASPAIRAKLAATGDAEGARILDVILRDEIGHVAIGNRWYRWLCAERGLDPIATYEELVCRFAAPVLRGPFNLPARRLAGFEERELERLQQRATDAAGNPAA